jgi:hypothetical protein
MRRIASASVFLTFTLIVQAQSPAPLTNADVIHFVAVGVSEPTVIAAVRESKSSQFDISERATRVLTAGGVSGGIISAMRQAPGSAQRGSNPPAPAARGSNPQTTTGINHSKPASTLLKTNAVNVEKHLGKPAHVDGHRWTYETSVRILSVYFDDAGMVIGAEPPSFDLSVLKK